MKYLRKYLIRVGDMSSQAVNTVFLLGDPGESVSGRSYRRGTIEGSTGWRRVQRVIDWAFSRIEQDHCRLSYETDLQRAADRLWQAGRLFTRCEINKGNK